LAPRPTPSQQSWLNHLFGGQEDFRSKPAPATKPSPAQRGAQTRARNRARAASSATPYTPEMQNEGNFRGKKVNLTNPPKASPSVSSGARVNAAGSSYGGPPPPPKSTPTTGPSSTTDVVKGVGRASKIRIPGIVKGLGAVGTVVGAVSLAKDIYDKAPARRHSSFIIGPASTKVARDYSPQTALAVQDYARTGSPEDYTRVQNEARKSYRAPGAQTPAKVRLSSKPNIIPSYVPKRSGQKPGKFVSRAYAANRLRMDIGQVTGQNYFNSDAEEGVRNKFLKHHKWARNTKTETQKKDLDEAVRYLVAKRHRSYF
jgi:hypothetical protein